jgi:hypothetical protein
VNPLLEQGLVEVTVVHSVRARAAGEDGRSRNNSSLHVDSGSPSVNIFGVGGD